MARIVFSDSDGTLLTDDKRVTEKTEQAVKGLVQQGIPFVLVSARMPEAIYPITEAMGVKIPLISYSGALVLTEEGMKIQRDVCRELDEFDEKLISVLTEDEQKTLFELLEKIKTSLEEE